MKKITNTTKKVGYMLVLAFIAVGCASAGANLKPAVPTPKTPMNDAVKVTNVKGVSMTVQADAWPGDPGIARNVTPLQVTIHNNSDMKVVVSYNDFSIITPDGEYHAAIPPFETKGKVDQLELAQHYGPIEPGFVYNNFEIAPLYDPIYDIGVYAPYGFYNYSYYNDYYGFWNEIDDYNAPLPTGKMLSHAMPEGVVMPGGMIKGFLYFQKIEADESNWVKFIAQLKNADTGRMFGTVSIPYDVAGN